MFANMFSRKAEVMSLLEMVFASRLQALAIESMDHDEWTLIKNDPDKLAAWEKEQGISSGTDFTAGSVEEMLDHASAAAYVAEIDLEQRTEESKAIEEEIQDTQKFLELIRTGDANAIAAQLQEKAIALRQSADELQRKLEPLTGICFGGTESDYARYWVPQKRQEAEILDSLAKLLLLDVGSPYW